jgi:L-alanine-DL-glutamate epimerase-like enolase superfamily enzyme
MQVSFKQVDWEFATPLRIAYRVRTHAQTVQVTLEEDGHVGRGEALGVSYRGESVASMLDQLSAIQSDLRHGASRTDLQKLLPAGGARNALDCALWDLEAKRTGRRAWELAGLPTVRPLTTAFTLGVDTAERMAQTAAASRRYSLLKIKLAGEGDAERVAAVREARPDADLIVDANQAWHERQLSEFTARFAALGVQLIEQPLPAGQDGALSGFATAVPLCADESCQTTESLPALQGKYRYVNIKLDKTGGLTEALRLARMARDMGFELMVGCMAGSSLSMAPAFIVGQLCDFVDLDGPLLATADLPNGIRYEGSRMFLPERSLWG